MPFSKDVPTLREQCIRSLVTKTFEDGSFEAFSESDVNTVIAFLDPLPSGVHSDLCRAMVYHYSGLIDTRRLRLGNLLAIVSPSRITCLDLSGLGGLSAVTKTQFETFHSSLVRILSQVPLVVELLLQSSRTSMRTTKRDSQSLKLPYVTDEHLAVIGRFCGRLRRLNLSFNRALTAKGLAHLVPDQSNEGCPQLIQLDLFDCNLYSNDLAEVVVKLSNLCFLGFQETGRVIKAIHKTAAASDDSKPQLSLVQVNNLGSKAARISSTGLRCRKPLATAIAEICSGVENLKVRVADADVAHLAMLERLKSVELVYNAGSTNSPSLGTTRFLEIRGVRLHSLALICNSMSMVMLKTIGECCPNLHMLWLRSNHFVENQTLVVESHNYFSNLETLYLRIGQNQLSVVKLDVRVLQYVLKNAVALRELLVAVRSETLTDTCVTQELIAKCNLGNLEKVIFVVPELNNHPKILPLTIETVEFILQYCPCIRKIGNLLSWQISQEQYKRLDDEMKYLNYEVELMFKCMKMH